MCILYALNIVQCKYMCIEYFLIFFIYSLNYSLAELQNVCIFFFVLIFGGRRRFCCVVVVVDMVGSSFVRKSGRWQRFWSTSSVHHWTRSRASYNARERWANFESRQMRKNTNDRRIDDVDSRMSYPCRAYMNCILCMHALLAYKLEAFGKPRIGRKTMENHKHQQDEEKRTLGLECGERNKQCGLTWPLPFVMKEGFVAKPECRAMILDAQTNNTAPMSRNLYLYTSQHKHTQPRVHSPTKVSNHAVAEMNA